MQGGGAVEGFGQDVPDQAIGLPGFQMQASGRSSVVDAAGDSVKDRIRASIENATSHAKTGIRGTMTASEVAKRRAEEKALAEEADFDSKEKRSKSVRDADKAAQDLRESRARESDLYANADKKKREAAAGEKRVHLPADKALLIAGTKSAIEQLDGLEAASNDLGFGKNPKTERMRGSDLNPMRDYDTNVNDFQQHIASTKQVIGKGLEGGVLRAEDEKKYEKIIPKLGDTKEILERKKANLRELLINKHNNEVGALESAGYEMSGFSRMDSGKKGPRALSVGKYSVEVED